MQPDKQLSLPARQSSDSMKVPDFVEQIAFVGHGKRFDGKWVKLIQSGISFQLVISVKKTWHFRQSMQAWKAGINRKKPRSFNFQPS
jgi:hypothetical protein